MSVRRYVASVLLGSGALTLAAVCVSAPATPVPVRAPDGPAVSAPDGPAVSAPATGPQDPASTPPAVIEAGAAAAPGSQARPVVRDAAATTAADPDAAAPRAAADTVRYTGRVVVKMADPGGPTPVERVHRAVQAAGASLGAATTTRQTATGGTVISVSGDPVAAAQSLAAQPGVEYAVPERRLQTAADPNDPDYPSQWDLPAIHVPQAWPYSRGAGVTVAVIDTGSLPHPDLQGQYLPGYDFISDPAYSGDGDGRDADPTDAGDWTPYGVCDDPAARNSSWHGVHVAGTIAALTGNGVGIAGIAPAARLVPVRALGRCGGTDTDITDAVVWAAGGTVPGVPANANPAKIINLSLSGPGRCTPVEQAAIDVATSRGALVIVAAGNDGADVSGYTPANCRGVVVVGAIGQGDIVAPYSNSGSAVLLAAPGSAIRSLGNRGSRTADPAGWIVLTRSGTSMAAPHVSAVAALVWSVAPRLTAAQVRDVLTRTADRFPTPTRGFGAGVLDAVAAVDAARPTDQPAPVISQVSPPAARTRGGDAITITGTGLSGATVTVAGQPARISSGTATSLIVAVPAGTAGATQIVVTTGGGTTAAAFRYDTRYAVQRGGAFTPIR